MQYIKVRWIQSNVEYPIWLYSELTDQRWETRKLEIFSDGMLGFADSNETYGDTRLGTEPLPPLEEIRADRQFVIEEISQREFEKIWEQRHRSDKNKA
jgi:hypothetical protein